MKAKKKDGRHKKKTTQQILKDQLEDVRTQLQKEIEVRMKAEKVNRMNHESISSYKEGLNDILRVVVDIATANNEDLQQSQGVSMEIEDEGSDENEKQSEELDSASEDEQEIVQKVIAKIFEVQRHYQAQLSDVNHSLAMEKLRLEDMESLTLDLEILNEEKALTEKEMKTIKGHL